MAGRAAAADPEKATRNVSEESHPGRSVHDETPGLAGFWWRRRLPTCNQWSHVRPTGTRRLILSREARGQYANEMPGVSASKLSDHAAAWTTFASIEYRRDQNDIFGSDENARPFLMTKKASSRKFKAGLNRSRRCVLIRTIQARSSVATER